MISRRAVLGGVAATAVAGCAQRGPSGAETDLDDTLLEEVRIGLSELAGRYAGVLRRHPDLGPTVRPLLGHVEEQLGILGSATDVRARRFPARNARTAVEALIAELEAALVDRRRQCLRAGSGDFARVLASIATSHAQHAVVLGSTLERETP
jgi:hypothetical protein